MLDIYLTQYKWDVTVVCVTCGLCNQQNESTERPTLSFLANQDLFLPLNFFVWVFWQWIEDMWMKAKWWNLAKWLKLITAHLIFISNVHFKRLPSVQVNLYGFPWITLKIDGVLENYPSGFLMSNARYISVLCQDYSVVQLEK